MPESAWPPDDPTPEEVGEIFAALRAAEGVQPGTDRPHDLAAASEPLSQIRELAARMAAGAGEPYEDAHSVVQLAMELAVDDERGGALWLVWGRLTDRFELRPDEEGEAAADVRLAASQWIEVEGGPVRREAILRSLDPGPLQVPARTP